MKHMRKYMRILTLMTTVSFHFILFLQLHLGRLCFVIYIFLEQAFPTAEGLKYVDPDKTPRLILLKRCDDGIERLKVPDGGWIVEHRIYRPIEPITNQAGGSCNSSVGREVKKFINRMQKKGFMNRPESKASSVRNTFN